MRAPKRLHDRLTKCPFVGGKDTARPCPQGRGLARAVSAPTLPVAADALVPRRSRSPWDGRRQTISAVRGRSLDTIAHGEADGKPSGKIVICVT
ncbi:hypothetical protein GCM10010429_51940 [Micromonospora olivasterospora]